MRIGELASAASVSAKTVRYYESIGLLAPPGRTTSGYRDYLPADIERLQFVRDAQASGLSLAEIQSVLDLKDSGEGSCAHTASLLERHVADIDEQLARLVEARRELVALATRAKEVDPTACVDPNRCQVIAPPTSPAQ